MRSGLQKPAAVPLVAILVFSLLSLVPTIAKEWDLDLSFGLGLDLGFYKYGVDLAYLGQGLGLGLGLGLPRYDTSYSSRVKNASIDTVTRSSSRWLRTNDNPCKSWLFGDFYSSCIDPNTQPHYSANIPPRSSFEAGAGAIADPVHDPITFSPTKEPSTITRGVSAFKEFVIKRWDDQQITQTQTQPLPPRHEYAADEISTHPTPTPANVSVSLASARGKHGQPHPPLGNEPEPAAENSAETLSSSRLPLFMLGAWQQVCRGGHYLESWMRPYSAYPFNQTLIPKSAPTLNHSEDHADELPAQQQAEGVSTDELPSNSAANESSPALLRKSQNSTSSHHLMTAGQSKQIGMRRNSEHMCGSSMAIVIALVAGIMWF